MYLKNHIKYINYIDNWKFSLKVVQVSQKTNIKLDWKKKKKITWARNASASSWRKQSRPIDLTPLGSEISTNSLFELLTVYTAVPAKVLATWSELRVAANACLGWARDAKGGGGGDRRKPLETAGGQFPARVPAKRLVSSSRLTSSEPNRRQCWWMKVESESRGFEEP